MCGIVGIAGARVTRAGISIFEDLMIVSNLRGRWGAGACVVTTKSIMSYKTEWSGVDVIDMKGYREKVYGDEGVTTLIGHTRHPTKGGQTVDDSHPHVFDNVTGVHNGTLTRVNHEFVKDSQSDSRMFYKHLNDDGFDKAISYAQGAYCFVWVDHKAETLNFYRNSQRPMWIAKLDWGKPGQALVWASEREFLELVLKRRDVTKDIVYVELPTNEYWSIPLGFKLTDDFTKVGPIYGGSGYWKPLPGKKKEEVAPDWGHGFRRNSVPGFSRNASVTSDVGKKTYVYKDGEFIEKDSILNPPAKKVSLPRPQDADELKGTEALRLPAPTGVQGRVPDEQRRKALTKVSLGSNAASFLKNLTKGIRKEEAEFYSDTVVDLFPKKNDDGPNYERDNREIEEEFNKLLAQKDASSSALWEDLQDGDIPATKMMETMKGHYVPRDHYLSILRNGCCWSGDAADEKDEIHWVDSENFIMDYVLYDAEAMADLVQVYPNHPLLKEMAKRLNKTIKKQAKGNRAQQVTIH